jgi:hypothetical protein
VQRESGSNDVAVQVKTLYKIALSREPTAGELARQVDFISKQREFHQSRTGSSGTAEPNPALAALTDLTHVMLNANEFVYMN